MAPTALCCQDQPLFALSPFVGQRGSVHAREHAGSDGMHHHPDPMTGKWGGRAGTAVVRERQADAPRIHDTRCDAGHTRRFYVRNIFGGNRRQQRLLRSVESISDHRVGYRNGCFTVPEVNVYPEPNRGSFLVQRREARRVERMHIYDIPGRTVGDAEWMLPATAMLIDLRGFPDGLYLLRVIGGTRWVTPAR